MIFSAPNPLMKIMALMQHYLKCRFLTVKHHIKLKTKVHIKSGHPNYNIWSWNVVFRLILVKGTITAIDSWGLSSHSSEGVKHRFLKVSSYKFSLPPLDAWLTPSFSTKRGYLIEKSYFQATFHKTKAITTFGLLFISLKWLLI